MFNLSLLQGGEFEFFDNYGNVADKEGPQGSPQSLMRSGQKRKRLSTPLKRKRTARRRLRRKRSNAFI